jgi:hypothetical protein
MGYSKSQKITLKNAPYYSSSDQKTAQGKKSGTFYIWSAATKNGKIRITTKKSYAGKTPASKYVTCWVKTSSIKTSSSGSTNGSTKNASTKTPTTTKNTTSTTSNASPDSKKNTTTVINIVENSDVTPEGTAQGQIGFLGKVLFVVSANQIKTLDSFTLTESARYVEHDRHLKTPKVEFTGVDASKISFTMTLNCYLGTSIWDDYNTLASYMTGGVAVPLRIGSKTYGNYRWCIQSLSVKGNSTDAKGNWTSADVTVALISIEKKG